MESVWVVVGEYGEYVGGVYVSEEVARSWMRDGESVTEFSVEDQPREEGR